VDYEEEGVGVVVTCKGHVSGSELKKINAQICEKERARKLRYQIWDFTHADSLQVSASDARDLAIQDQNAAKTNPKQIVVIVGDRKFFEGYDRLFHIFEQVWAGFASTTCSTMKESRTWVSGMITEK
jgi:hypothetical protein